MDKEKFSATVAEMKTLTSDFAYVDTTEVKELLVKMIVEKARILVELTGLKVVKETNLETALKYWRDRETEE